MAEATATAEKTEKPAFDWGAITGHNVARLRKPKTPDLPKALIHLAQLSWDEDKAVKEHDFGTDEAKAKAFVKIMRQTGALTTPKTTVQAEVEEPGIYEDGDKEGQEHGWLGRWQATVRRGRGTAREV